MAYSNWKNPFENNNDIPEVPDDWYVWYNNYQETPQPKQPTTNYADYTRAGQPVMWNAPSGPIKGPQIYNWAKEHNLFEPILKWPSPMPKATPPNPQPTRTLKQSVYPTSNKQLSQYEQTKYQYLGEKGRAASGQVFPGTRVPAGPVLSTNKTFPGMVVPNTNARYRANPPISTYGLMGSTIRPDLNSLDSIRRWLAAESLKYGSQGTTFPGVTIPQDRSVNVDTGYRIPTSMPNDNFGNYGGYLSYGGGGGGYSYKPAPKPWYMSLTNWRI